MADVKKEDEELAPGKGKFEAKEVTELSFVLDEAQKKAIRRCLDRGELRVTMSKVDFSQGGRFVGAYEYD